jgi:hypothetical protein
MSGLWVPGIAAGPQDEFVARLHRLILQFAVDEGVDEASVQVELVDGVRLAVHSISAEPGFGFVTIRPHSEDRPETPGAVVVPVGSIKRIELDRAAAEKGLLGFSALDEPVPEG